MSEENKGSKVLIEETDSGRHRRENPEPEPKKKKRVSGWLIAVAAVVIVGIIAGLAVYFVQQHLHSGVEVVAAQPQLHVGVVYVTQLQHVLDEQLGLGRVLHVHAVQGAVAAERDVFVEHTVEAVDAHVGRRLFPGRHPAPHARAAQQHEQAHQYEKVTA